MSNGPLTPPPTSATEIQDEQRSNNAPASTSQPPAPPSQPSATAPVQTPTPLAQPSSYEIAFPGVAQLAQQKKWNELAISAEIAEVNGDNARPEGRLLVTAPLVLAYLIQDDLNAAHYTLLRLPSNLSSGALAKELAALVKASRDRKHAEVYSRAESLIQQASQASPDEGPLAGVVSGMVAAFVESFRIRTFTLLSKAYRSLPLALAQTYLGLPADRLLLAAQSQGWTYDSSSEILTPESPISAASGRFPSTLATFDFVSDSVAALEA